MHIGWRIFSYSKSVETEDDYKSFCNTNIRQYGQVIFEDNTIASTTGNHKTLSIYGSVAKQLELVISKGIVIVSLSVWRADSTTAIVLERCSLTTLKLEKESRNIYFKFKTSSKKDFKVIFYKEEETIELLKIISNNEEEYMLIDGLLKSSGPIKKVYKKDVLNFRDFLRKIYEFIL